ITEKMEPYELEYLLSPCFTPDLKARQSCQPLLSDQGLSNQAQNDLIEALSQREILCPIIAYPHSTTLRIPEIIIERYVRLLQLTRAAIEAETLRRLISESSDHLNEALTLSRDKVWSTPVAANLLKIWLQQINTPQKRNHFTIHKLTFLTEFVGSYRPKNKEQIIAMLSSYHASCKTETHVYHDEAHECSDVRAKHLTAEHKDFRLHMSETILADFQESTP
ncbi:hypothetical protein ACQZV8_07745, partial [Magnetococcales bacterium HHB-1]